MEEKEGNVVAKAIGEGQGGTQSGSAFSDDKTITIIHNKKKMI